VSAVAPAVPAAPVVAPARPAWRDALAGSVAVAVSIGASELAAGLIPGFPSLVAAVGSAVIDLQPPGAKDFVVALFGQNDKLALELFVVFAALAFGAVVGLVARRWSRAAILGFAGFGFLAFLATLLDPQVSTPLAALSASGAVWLGTATLGRLVDRKPPGDDDSMPDWSRRGFLLRSGSVALAAGVAGFAGRALLESRLRRPSSVAGAIPQPGRVATLPPAAELTVPGITPLIVPNEDFYRIDTALLVPSVDVTTWTLRIHGMVDRETTLSFDDLVGLPLFEQYVTIACVSNEVGGGLVGNAKWTGVSLRDVLDMAGVQAGATQLVGRSVDGFTAGMPTGWVMDPAREAMIAVLMNEEPLPMSHGFPARLIVPGLYGYVSATKWLSELELTTLEGFDAFWIPRGWSKEAPILTQSRIDVPKDRARVAAGRVAVAGVAWAPDRGVSGVEVSVDDGPWTAARISTPISDATWVQWRLDWEATAGRHTLAVRATDGDGAVQTADRSAPAPDGARGHHRVAVEVA
jgi:DMSO/TMAO reductase YedYZ molybdopterin-dependent catalytic subunit